MLNELSCLCICRHMPPHCSRVGVFLFSLFDENLGGMMELLLAVSTAPSKQEGLNSHLDGVDSSQHAQTHNIGLYVLYRMINPENTTPSTCNDQETMNGWLDDNHNKHSLKQLLTNTKLSDFNLFLQVNVSALAKLSTARRGLMARSWEAAIALNHANPATWKVVLMWHY